MSDPLARKAVEDLNRRIDAYNDPASLSERAGNHTEHTRLMMDMIALAFWTDTTRISTFMFGNAVSDLTMTRQIYVERASSPEEYCALFMESFGPLIAIRESLAPARQAELDRAFLQGVVRWNQGRSTGPVEIPYEYLLVIAHTAARLPRIG